MSIDFLPYFEHYKESVMKYRMHQGLLVHCRYFYANMNCLRFSSSARCAWDVVTSLHLTVLMKYTTIRTTYV